MSIKQARTGKTAAERIRATAAKLFYRQGIRAVGVDELVIRAGATKPSLYRSFKSKDDLAAAYLRDYAAAYWVRFDAAVSAHADNPRAQLRELFTRWVRRIREPGFRGCALSNAAVEYPDSGHQARLVAQQFKREVRRRLIRMVTKLRVASPKLLADGLLLLLEGAYVNRQLFGSHGPSLSLARLAQRMIDGWPRHPRLAARNAPAKDHRGRRRQVRALG